jgi:hypothetical protein
MRSVPLALRTVRIQVAGRGLQEDEDVQQSPVQPDSPLQYRVALRVRPTHSLTTVLRVVHADCISTKPA